jgi:hypothetical protein
MGSEVVASEVDVAVGAAGGVAASTTTVRVEVGRAKGPVHRHPAADRSTPGAAGSSLRRKVDAADRQRERCALMTRMVAISGLGSLGSGGLAANPGEYPPALRSTLPGAVMKATVAPETGVHLGNVG